VFGSLESDVTSFHGPLVIGSFGFGDILISTHMMYRTMKELAMDRNWPCNGMEASMEIGEQLSGVKLVLIEI
jgi:hypothetical protein